MAKLDLTQYGITGSNVIAHNPSYEVLFNEETKAGLTGFDKGQNTELNAVNVMTGIYTGRSPKDKYIVDDAQSHDKVWWTTDEYKNDNHPMSEDVWATVKDIAIKELCNKDLYVVDAFCGANEGTRLAVRFIVEVAWQAHFVKNMFIQPTEEELANFEPNFVIYNASKAKVENYKELGLNSETCVAFNTTSREQVIINTWYGGEMKKGMFSMQNYYLPLQGRGPYRLDRDTHQIIQENRESIFCQWRATPLGVAEKPVDYKGGELSNHICSEFHHITVRPRGLLKWWC
jgi:phosphoenolpyruvate carboxykinase (ATP)